MNELLSHYAEIVTDPAHLLAELTFIVLVDVVFLGLCVPVLRRYLRREHLKQDAEHGVTHGRVLFHRRCMTEHSVFGSCPDGFNASKGK